MTKKGSDRMTNNFHIVVPAPAEMRDDPDALRAEIAAVIADLVTDTEVLDEPLNDDQVAVRVTLGIDIQCVVALRSDDGGGADDPAGPTLVADMLDWVAAAPVPPAPWADGDNTADLEDASQ